MPSLANHQSNQFTKLLLIGDAKCVDGDTIIKVTRGRSIGRAMTIRDLYSRTDSSRSGEDKWFK